MDNLSMFNFVDAIVGVILLFGLLGGLKRGLSGELSRVIMYVVAGYAAWKFASPAADKLMESASMTVERGYITAFIGILIGAFIVMWLVRVILRNIFEFAFKGKIERIGGALCGLTRAAIFASVLLIMGGFIPQAEIRNLVAEKSFFGRLVQERLTPLLDSMRDKIPGLPSTSSPSVTDDESEMTGDGELGEYQETYDQPAIEIQDEPEPEGVVDPLSP